MATDCTLHQSWTPSCQGLQVLPCTTYMSKQHCSILLVSVCSVISLQNPQKQLNFTWLNKYAYCENRMEEHEWIFHQTRSSIIRGKTPTQWAIANVIKLQSAVILSVKDHQYILYFRSLCSLHIYLVIPELCHQCLQLTALQQTNTYKIFFPYYSGNINFSVQTRTNEVLSNIYTDYYISVQILCWFVD